MSQLRIASTILAELKARGISVAASKSGEKLLVRDGVELGWFTANNARVQLLDNMGAKA